MWRHISVLNSIDEYMTFFKTWVMASNRVYEPKLTDGAVLRGRGWWGRSGSSSCRISVTEEMLFGANIPLPHCFTCRNGQVRVGGVLDFCLWHQSMESKMFSVVQVPLLRGEVLTPMAFEAYFSINATFPLLSLPSLWRKHGTAVTKPDKRQQLVLRKKPIMHRFSHFCEDLNLYINRKQLFKQL